MQISYIQVQSLEIKIKSNPKYLKLDNSKYHYFRLLRTSDSRYCLYAATLILRTLILNHETHCDSQDLNNSALLNKTSALLNNKNGAKAWEFALIPITSKNISMPYPAKAAADILKRLTAAPSRY